MARYGMKPLPQVGSKAWLKELAAALDCPTFPVTPSKTPLKEPPVIHVNYFGKEKVMSPGDFINLQIGRAMIDEKGKR